MSTFALYGFAAYLSFAALLVVGLFLASLVEKRWQRRHPLRNLWSSYLNCLAAVLGSVAVVAGSLLLAWPLSQLMDRHQGAVAIASYVCLGVIAIVIVMAVAGLVMSGD